MLSKIRAYYLLMRMDRPIGSLLLLWPTLWALAMASEGKPQWGVLIVFCLGVFLMRSAGCVINDFADRDFDGHVERTQFRPIPSGLVSAKEALALFGVLSVVSFSLVLTMNTLTIQLSFIGVALAALYPFMKRFTHLPQLVLGIAFSWAIPMAWAAESGHIAPLAWLLFAINLLWTVAYDTQYAMVDREDDLKIGIKSTAILFGRFDKLIIGLLQATTIVLLLVVGESAGLSGAFYWGVLVAASLFVYQQWLIKTRCRTQCFQAFLNNNYVGIAVTAGLFISYL
ncbi:4-hydroxybenzoate octaprenyltransferase [Vibrio halioticoli NBRC 102217]|uniref:4-hydroxybenzoate octaprenyltransferase n=1 Tax=Vibrio halioticoli NBRC 102217 TaxID=1219072 RepID=V5FN05_9VIBR|nr:4-hydroxybenzoate octaprenyltransferase [Vibrio halioticoli]GAD90981.1 4-hydroxybenzoate octaprenyltransferase [Vibrio halioticoli NBRC 102217]